MMDLSKAFISFSRVARRRHSKACHFQNNVTPQDPTADTAMTRAGQRLIAADLFRARPKRAHRSELVPLLLYDRLLLGVRYWENIQFLPPLDDCPIAVALSFFDRVAISVVAFDHGGLFGFNDTCHWSGDECRCDAGKDKLVHC